ncbi:MAG: hypothetical protein JKX79_00175 [Labilibaculum sp.]|nr:hypothetical protein [Labilibaculum sp.]
MSKDNWLEIFRNDRITPLHKALMKCIEFNFVYPNEIKNILYIIPQYRLTLTLSDLIENSIIEIDDVFGCLSFTDDYYLIRDNLSSIMTIMRTNNDFNDKRNQIKELFENLDMNHPKQLVNLINLRNGK